MMEQPVAECRQQPLLGNPLKAQKLPSNEERAIKKRLTYVLALSCTFMAIEIVGAIFSNSIAVFSDVAHIFSDILRFSVSIASIWLSGVAANKQYTYGYHRAGVIGALASVLITWVLTGFLVYFAIVRITNIDKVQVNGQVMFGTACFGLVSNLILMKVLRWESSSEKLQKVGLDHMEINAEIKESGKPVQSTKISIISHNPEDVKCPGEDLAGRQTTYPSPQKETQVEEIDQVSGKMSFLNIPEKEQIQLNRRKFSYLPDSQNLNVRATMVHIFGELVQSIGLIIGSLLVWIDPVHLKLADPILTLLFSLVVLYTSSRLLNDCVHALMEATPIDIDIEEFETEFTNIEGVVNVHDFHVWTLGEGKLAMTAHILTNTNAQTVLRKVTELCREYEVYHSTIQVEIIDNPEHPHYVDCKHEIH